MITAAPAVVVAAVVDGTQGGSSGMGGGRRAWLLVQHVPRHDPIPPRLLLIIDDLLASRLDARRRRAFNKANAIHGVLLNVHGVNVWDLVGNSNFWF
jgi:hypothetical protein